MIIFLKLLWFSFIAFFPLWFGVIGGLVLLLEEKVLGVNFDE